MDIDVPHGVWGILFSMMTRFSSLSPGVSFLVLSLAFALALGACGSDDDGGPAPGIVPDFALTDVNPNSATFNTEVSPRDYRERISAWYFGSST